MGPWNRWSGVWALGLVVLAETVCFAGQPGSAHPAELIAHWYSGAWGRVVLGNVAWVAAAYLLWVAVDLSATRISLPRLPAVARVLGGLGAATMVATSVVALVLTFRARLGGLDGISSLWSWESRAFTAGTWLLLGALLVLCVGRLAGGDVSAVLPAAAAACALLDLWSTRWWATVAGLALLALLTSPVATGGQASFHRRSTAVSRS